MDISFIIPMYNAEKYIKECLNSIFEQTSDISYEVIVVDDGSTDSSCDIVSNCAYKNIKLISQQNKGVSAARNSGLKLATGNWIAFVDADDIVASDYFVSVSRMKLLSSKYDIILFQNGMLGERKRTSDYKILEIDDDLKAKLLTRQFWIDDKIGIADISTGTPWAKLYKKDIVKDLCFPQGVFIGEDMMFNFAVLTKAKSGCLEGYRADYLRRHSESATVRYRDNIVPELDIVYEAINATIRNYALNEYSIYRTLYYSAVLNCVYSVYTDLYLLHSNHRGSLLKREPIKKVLRMENLSRAC